MQIFRSDIPWARWSGEFIVIVLGVAIGFQVDRWYEQRQDRVTASEYIVRLKEDISRDIENSKGGLDSANSRMESLKRVIESVSSDTVIYTDPTRYMFDLRRGFMRYLPVPSDSTYRELESTGNMSLLSLELRSALHNYYSEIDSYSQFLGGYESMQIEAYRRFAGILPPENFGVLSGVIEPGDITYSSEQALESAMKLRNNQPALDWLYQMGELKAQEIRLSRSFLHAAEDIYSMLDGI